MSANRPTRRLKRSRALSRLLFFFTIQAAVLLVAGMRRYSAEFPPLLERARTATPAQLTELIQANTVYRRDAYNLLLEMLPELRANADRIVVANSLHFRRVQIPILGGMVLAI